MSAIDVAIQVFRLLNVPTITSLARVYQHNRPQNSKNVDVVIRVPNYSDGTLLTGTIDIRVHAPNPTIPVDGKPDSTFPNTGLIRPVVDAILPLIQSSTDILLTVESAGTMEKEADGTWFATIRVSFDIIGVAATDVILYRILSQPDGFGGVTTQRDEVWVGKSSMQNVGNGTQLNIIAGRYQFNLRCDWLIPIKPEKNWQLHTSEGVYVINGISPDGKLWRVSTARRDSLYEDTKQFNTIINAMPPEADYPTVYVSAL